MTSGDVIKPSATWINRQSKPPGAPGRVFPTFFTHLRGPQGPAIQPCRLTIFACLGVVQKVFETGRYLEVQAWL
ncbi:hypothetical protein [Marivita sp.]|uniref:hypothetical protein n=1 Tax=Marivita sp. TaxID=2003365 RepID=UPI0025B9DD7C|nr:hypothetical protein [Marivita sp.]